VTELTVGLTERVIELTNDLTPKGIALNNDSMKREHESMIDWTERPNERLPLAIMD